MNQREGHGEPVLLTVRPLTVEESDKLLRSLIIALGASAATHALRVIAEAGVGIYREV